MPKFKTHAERMKHKQAKLIPSSMWYDNQLFYESLNDTVLSLMKVKLDNLMSHLNKSLPKLNDKWLKKQAWIAIALSQPVDLPMLLAVATTLKLDKNTVFSLLATLGNTALLSEFTIQQDTPNIQKMLEDDEFCAYIKAAENGHSTVLKFFEMAVPFSVRKMILSRNCSPYKDAARNGHVEVLEHLEDTEPDLVLEMIKAQNFYAYRIGASKGQLAVLKHLEAKAPDLVRAMVAADNFYAFNKSVENNHFEVSEWILAQSSMCFAYAEMHEQEYGSKIIEPFIKERLHALHRDAINTPHHNVFNISDPEQAKICFYVIRNLIRRNDRALDDEIRFLLSIPSVKALAHSEVTLGRPNELMRLALTMGNQEAVSILLNVPEIRMLTEQNDFYRSEINGQLNLDQLVQDQESSMVALSRGEQKRLDNAIKRYQPMLKSKGVNHLINDLRAQLRGRYEKNPASIINDEGNKIVLPMDFAAFKKLKLSENEYQSALKAYYQHKDHSAWRYLQKPNPWMNPEASYVYRNVKTGERWATFEEYQPLIALFWLAACDDNELMAPTDGHTLESRLAHFIDELALIGRAHNWDKTRLNEQGKEEEYDDLTGDCPSCFSGVKRRLFQSVLGHPLITIFTEDSLLEEIRDFSRSYFRSKINKENQIAFKEAFDDYVININGISSKNIEFLMSLNIPEETIHEFGSYLSEKYGAQYTEDYQLRKVVHDKLSLEPKKGDIFSQSHALMLDGITGFYQMINEPLDEISTDLIQADRFRFFKSEVVTDKIPTEITNSPVSVGRCA